MPNWRLSLGLLAAAAYAVLSHWLMLHAADRPWAVAALLGPLLLAGLGVALRRGHLPSLAGFVFALLGLYALVARGGVGDLNRLYLLQHAGIHLALFISFAASLRPGRLSLIGGVAQRVHGRLSPDMVVYTGKVTRMWAGYFLAMVLASLCVYALAPWSVWSLLANLVTPVLITTLFVGEYLLRYRLHPEFERTTLSAALRAYCNKPASGEAAGR
ncbi:hypothetical protein [Methylibium sp.]|uniref:hypothetical protein n=1 Tax=Methylibium sp. TaxID=2067992 RepID=UPI003D0C1B4C